MKKKILDVCKKRGYAFWRELVRLGTSEEAAALCERLEDIFVMSNGETDAKAKLTALAEEL